MLVTMVLKLLVIKNTEMTRENIVTIPFLSGISIKEKVNLFSVFTVFSLPKALSKP
jgi:hypothetical protein